MKLYEHGPFAYDANELRRLWESQDYTKKEKIAAFFNILGIICHPCPVRILISVSMDEKTTVPSVILFEARRIHRMLDKCKDCIVCKYYFDLVLENEEAPKISMEDLILDHLPSCPFCSAFMDKCKCPNGYRFFSFAEKLIGRERMSQIRTAYYQRKYRRDGDR